MFSYWSLYKVSLLLRHPIDTVSHVGIFDPALWTVSLIQLSPFHLFPVWLSILHTRTQCVRGGGYEVLGLRQINTCRKVPIFLSILFRWRNFALPFISLILVLSMPFCKLCKTTNKFSLLYSLTEISVWPDEVKSMDPVKVRKVNMSDFLESMKRIKKSIASDNLGKLAT